MPSKFYVYPFLPFIIMATPITPSIAPGNFYSPQTVSFNFSSDVTGVALTNGAYPPSLSKYIAYDTLTPPGPFIAVTEDGRGRVLYDGGFPKIYNNRMPAPVPTTFAGLSPAHKYFHNVIKWIANPAKPKKILLLGDRHAGVNASYLIKSTASNGFYTVLTTIATIAGFTYDVKDATDYADLTLDMTAAELNQYAAVVFVSSWDRTTAAITNQAVNNLVAFREAGGGIMIITDHGYNLNSINDVNTLGSGFFKTGNAIASRFGAYFTGSYDRVAVNVGFLRSTYGDHPVYNGLLDTDDFAASGSESIIVVTETPIQTPSAVAPVTVSAVGMNQINLLANLKDGSIATAKFQYNIQNEIKKPFEMIVTNAGKALMDVALSSNTPITDFAVWFRPGTTNITAATTTIPGMTKMGTPEFAGNVSRTDSSFYIHLSSGLASFYPVTLAIMAAGTILAAVSIYLVNDVDVPYFIPLLMKGIDPKVFTSATNNTESDVLSVDSFNAFLSAQEKQRALWQPRLFEGNTLFGQGLGNPAKSEPMLIEVDVISTLAELEAAKLNVVSMQEVFNTWSRFSHHTANGGYSNEAYPAELSAWQYDAANDLIRCTVNSASTIGFVSPQKVKNYDLDVTLGSTDADDDLIGLIACANYVSTVNGNELRKMDYYRSCGGNGTGGARYNAGYPGYFVIANRNTAFKWGNGNYGATATEAGYNSGTTVADKTGWKYTPNGVRVRIERRNNILIMKASDLNDSTLLPASEVVVDLAADARYADFIDGARYGFICGSQLDSYWKVNSFIDYDKVIVDIANDKVYIYDGSTWIVDASRTPANIIKPGRFAYSSVNKKLYFRDSSGILINLTN